MIERRAILFAGLGSIGLLAKAAGRDPAAEWRWMYGKWRSDVEMTMENYTFQNKRLTQENTARISDLFGKMTHEISPGRFDVIYPQNGITRREERTFRVSRGTSSSVTLDFRGKDAPPELTLYKGEGFYMVRVGANFEYFKKVV